MEISMDHKTLLSFGFVLLCASVLNESLQSADAYPSGPNISLGNNPIANFSQTCSSWDTIYSNNTNQTYIITDVVHAYSGSNNATLKRNGQTIYESRDNHHFNSGLSIEPGESITCYNNGYAVTISGFYTH
jgi:hypothetical protein